MKHSDESLPTTSKCGTCDFVSDDETDINLHRIFHNNLTCDTCNLAFESERKLSNHMCRINITNPACGDSYMKNWIISNGCTRVFSTSLQTEIVFLHSQQCIDGVKSCPDILPDYDSDMVNYDGEVWHASVNLLRRVILIG